MAKTQHDIFAYIQDKKGRLLAAGRNSYTKTHPIMAKAGNIFGKLGYGYIHAEVAAMVRLKDGAKPHRIIISRFDVDGRPALAKPCFRCECLIKLAGIKYVEHT
jgi:tRNA(Arg) A34 adenosine deaminase TadA